MKAKFNLTVMLFAMGFIILMGCKKPHEVDGVATTELTSTTQNNKLTSTETLSMAAIGKKVNGKDVPFKGEYTISFEVLQPGPMSVQRVSGTGVASHLGKNTFVTITNVNFTTAPPWAVTGTRTITAANGDQIFTIFTGTTMPTGPTSSRSDLKDIITGGTGRFQNASGSFDATSTLDFSTSTFTVTFDGSINY